MSSAEKLGSVPPQTLDVDEAFFARLENWRRWAKKKTWGSMSAKSLESRYRSPIWYSEDVNFQRFTTEEKDAWEVERAWFSLPQNPVDYRGCVKYAWIWGEPYRATCRRLKIHWGKYDEVLGRALSMLRNRL